MQEVQNISMNIFRTFYYLFYPDNEAQKHFSLPLVLDDQQDFRDTKISQTLGTMNHFFTLSRVKIA